MKKSEQTKYVILDAAIKLIAHNGYSSTTTKAIAQEAGVSEATIFKYFVTKKELLKQIVMKIMDDFYGFAKNKIFSSGGIKDLGTTSTEVLTALFTERYNFFYDNFNTTRLVLQEMMINEEIRDMFKGEKWMTMKNTIDSLIIQGNKNGEFRDIDTEFIRKTIIGLLFYSSIIEKLLGLNENNDYSATKEAQIIIDIILNGIGGCKND